MLAGGVPLLAVTLWARGSLRRHWPAFGLSVAGSMAYAALAERGAGGRLWQASPEHISGLRWMGVPWEEWLSLLEIAAGITMFTIAIKDRCGR